MEQNQVVNKPNSPSPSSTNNQLILDGVESGLSAFIKKRWLILIIIFVIAIVLGFVNPILTVFILLFGFYIARLSYVNNLFSAFAKANNFSFIQRGTVNDQTGIAFSIGHNITYSDIIEGIYKDWTFLLFMYHYQTGYGRDRHDYHRAVITLKFNGSFPAFVLRRHMILAVLQSEGESLRGNGYTQKLNLEGDFNKHFEVYIRPNTQDDVLSILTPDVMQIIKPLDQFEIELVEEGSLHVYSRTYITKKEDLINLYKIVELIAPKLVPYIDRQNRINQLQQTKTPTNTTPTK